MLQQPFGIFYVVSSADPTAESLRGMMYFPNQPRQKAPELCATLFEMELPKVLIILDNSASPKPDSAYNELRKANPSYRIYSLQVNSCTPRLPHSETCEPDHARRFVGAVHKGV